MAEGILRRVTLGIAQETTYNTAISAATYVLPNTELTIEEIVNTVENTAMLGSSYEVNDVYATTEMVNISMTMKVDENILPLILRQKFSAAVSTVQSGAVYDHTLTYSASNEPASGQSFTLFLDDPDRGDQVVAGFRFDKLNIIAEVNNFLIIEAEGVGTFPVSGTVTNSTATLSREFVGRHASFLYDVYGGSPASANLYNLKLNNEFNLAGEEDSFFLGSENKQRNLTTIDRFTAEAMLPFTNYTWRDYKQNQTALESQVVITDTNRTIGSASNPTITIDYPKQKVIDWKREGGANDIHKQNVTLLALDDPSVATAPMQITVRNTVASYA